MQPHGIVRGLNRRMVQLSKFMVESSNSEIADRLNVDWLNRRVVRWNRRMVELLIVESSNSAGIVKYVENLLQ